MSPDDDLIRIDPDGSIRALGRRAVDQLKARAGMYRYVLSASGLIALVKTAPQSPEPGRNRVLMAGEIVSPSMIMDVINMICGQQWHGELLVRTGDVQHTMVFEERALKYAHSSDPANRLGPVLIHQGAVTEDEAEEIGRLQSSDGRRFGDLAVHLGYISGAALFEYLHIQMQQIFFEALCVAGGHYTFTTPAEDAPPPPIVVHLPVNGLLLEGAGRIDEMNLFRQDVPHSGLVPVRQEGGDHGATDPTLALTLSQCDGVLSIRDIRARLNFDEYDVTKAMYQLLQAGSIRLLDRQPTRSVSTTLAVPRASDTQPMERSPARAQAPQPVARESQPQANVRATPRPASPPKPATPSVATLVRACNRIVAAVLTHVARVDTVRKPQATDKSFRSTPSTRAVLRAAEDWLMQTGYLSYLGTLSEQGVIDVQHVTRSVDELRLERPLPFVEQLLHEFATFLLMSAASRLKPKIRAEAEGAIQSMLRTQTVDENDSPSEPSASGSRAPFTDMRSVEEQVENTLLERGITFQPLEPPRDAHALSRSEGEAARRQRQDTQPARGSRERNARTRSIAFRANTSNPSGDWTEAPETSDAAPAQAPRYAGPERILTLEDTTE